MSAKSYSNTTSSTLEISIVGDAFADLFCFLENGLPVLGGDSRIRHAIETKAGGSAVNTATHLTSLVQNFSNDDNNGDENESSRIPTRVTLHTCVNPNDDYGKLILNHAAKYGFPLYNCKTQESTSATGHCVVIVTKDDRSFMTHQGCMQDFEASDLQIESLVNAGIDAHIHIAGYYNIPGFWNGKLKQVLETIREKQPFVAISLVPQHDATEEWKGGLLELLPYLDFLILNQLEAERITGQNDEEKWASAFAAASPDTYILVTRGSHGAVALRRGKIVAKQMTCMVKVVDPTGAGDAFAAGFLYGLYKYCGKANSNDWSLEAVQQGLLWGCTVGTSNVLTKGASVPSKAKYVEDFLNVNAQLSQTSPAAASTKHALEQFNSK